MNTALILDNETNGRVWNICTAQQIRALGPSDNTQATNTQESDPKILDEVDMYILEVTHPAWDSHLLLAKAILLQKPTLCLYRKNYPPEEILSFIDLKGKPSLLRTFSYTVKNLEYAVKKFTELYDPAMVHENQANIKFTLRRTKKNAQ